MYLYVVIKSDEECKLQDVVSDKINIEESTKEEVKVIPYKEFTYNMVKELLPKAIIFSGFAPDLQTYDKNDFLVINEVIKKAEIPILCICGSHQLLSEIYNKDIYEEDKLYNYPIREQKKYESKRYKTNGFYIINHINNDEIFEGFGKKSLMRCLHSCEVKELPREFTLLASSYHSKVEAMKHSTKCIYSTQFHPEKYDDENLDGKRFLKNFSKIVDKFWNKKQY